MYIFIYVDIREPAEMTQSVKLFAIKYENSDPRDPQNKMVPGEGHMRLTSDFHMGCTQSHT